ncbi:MAG: thermonuclease family protein [Anaerohalosphaera sp.]|nr:thermonuclease family protein [Anaerohalosphaera sp.]
MKRFALFVLLTVATVSIDAAKNTPQPSKADAKALVSYGNAAVDKVIAVEDDFTFRCNIKDWPEIVAHDMPVRINAVAPPVIVIKEGIPNTFFQTQAKKLIENKLAQAEKIELRNVARGKTFSLVSDVFVDGKNLADILIEEGIARKLLPGEKYPSPKPKTEAAEKVSAADQRKVPAPSASVTVTYMASKSSKIFHKSTCRSAKVISDSNRISFGSRQQAISTGRSPCKICKP